MRIGEVNKDNYMEFTKMFGGKGMYNLDAMWGKSGNPNVQKYDANGKWINPYEDPSMDITGRDPSSYKIVDVSDDVRNKIVSLARSEFLGNYGKSDGEELSAIMRGYIKSVSPSERADVGWTLNQIWLNESSRLHSMAKSTLPGWEAGQPFDRDAVNDLISKNLDITV